MQINQMMSHNHILYILTLIFYGMMGVVCLAGFSISMVMLTTRDILSGGMTIWLSISGTTNVLAGGSYIVSIACLIARIKYAWSLSTDLSFSDMILMTQYVGVNNITSVILIIYYIAAIPQTIIGLYMYTELVTDKLGEAIFVTHIVCPALILTLIVSIASLYVCVQGCTFVRSRLFDRHVDCGPEVA